MAHEIQSSKGNRAASLNKWTFIIRKEAGRIHRTWPIDRHRRTPRTPERWHKSRECPSRIFRSRVRIQWSPWQVAAPSRQRSQACIRNQIMSHKVLVDCRRLIWVLSINQITSILKQWNWECAVYPTFKRVTHKHKTVMAMTIWTHKTSSIGLTTPSASKKAIRPQIP